MKAIKLVITTLCLCVLLHAQTVTEPLAEKIKKVSEELLEGYTQPLITAFGTGISTGLFHSATSHKTLGFDLGVRVMYIQIPGNAKYFDGTAVACSLVGNDIVYYDVDLDSVSTVFGPKEQTDIPVSGSAIGIPPYVPAGFNLSGVPLIMPQLNIGLIMGSELAIRYVPVKFKGSDINFLGLGLKQQVNSLPGINKVPLPLSIAVGGAIQRFSLKDEEGNQILNSQNWCVQLLASKRLVVFEPFVGIGLEGTKVLFRYDFEYMIPDTLSGLPVGVTREIEVELTSQNHYRAMAGFTLKLGFFYLHYDYNFLPYGTHNVIGGLTMR